MRPGEGCASSSPSCTSRSSSPRSCSRRPIRNGLFLEQYGAYALVYVYAAVPLVLSLFVPVYTRVAARFGARAVVTVGTLVFFSAQRPAVLVCVPRSTRAVAGRVVGWLLPAMFYVWVNCFGVIAPVQAWSFANSLFDTRQAKRLFGLIGAGASLGAIAAGLLARVLVEPGRRARSTCCWCSRP